MARKDHKSEAEVIRELLETGLQTKQEQHTASVGHALRRLPRLESKQVQQGLLICPKILTNTSMKKIDSSTLVVADTSGLMSLLVDTDANHRKALAQSAVFDESPGAVIIPSHVFTELMNVLAKKLGHQTNKKQPN